VHRYEGTVNQVMGDGIMALFGAPLAHEDHAVRACYAALRMQETVRQYADEVRWKLGLRIPSPKMLPGLVWFPHLRMLPGGPCRRAHR
jgi:class 3 adenylate cyclase